jgi:hypothetical protein
VTPPTWQLLVSHLLIVFNDASDAIFLFQPYGKSFSGKTPVPNLSALPLVCNRGFNCQALRVELCQKHVTNAASL